MSRFNHKETDLNLITDQNDLDLIQKYTENWNRANAAGDEAGKRAAHDAAEMIRARYQYSGGSNGNDYIRLAGENRASGSGGRSYDTSWLDKLNLNDGGYTYDANGKISSALDALLNREKFSYDAVVFAFVGNKTESAAPSYAYIDNLKVTHTVPALNAASGISFEKYDGTVYEYRKDSESTYRREGGSPIWKSRI